MPEWTREQKNAIDARTGALVVSAAAGSGKTAVLTERVVARMTDERDPVDADRLLIVTFTRAAAAEMRSRIGERLAALRAEQPNNPVLQRQQLLLPRAQISTIHAFCSNLLQKYYAYVNLTPDFRIAEDAQLADLRQRAADEVIEEFYAEKTDAFHGLVELLSTPRDDRGLVNTLFKLYNFILSHPFPEEWLEKQIALYDPAIPVEESVWAKTVLSYAADAFGYAERLCRQANDLAAADGVLTNAYGMTLQEDYQLIHCLRDAAEKQDWDLFLNLMGESVKFGTLKPVRKYDGAAKEQVKLLREEYKSAVAGLDKLFAGADAGCSREDIAALAPLMRSLAALTLRFRERFVALKLERGWLDYNDLEHYALHLLYTRAGELRLPTEIAVELSERYREVLVDEYQDCNAAQDMLFQAVSNGGENLFVVGDVKQSIYGFRQAMPDIFLRRMQSARPFDGGPGASRIDLARNFRSARGIVDAVNFLFGQLMSGGFGGVDYDDSQRLVFGCPRPDITGGPCVELRLLRTAGSGMKVQEAEYAYLPQLVEELLSSGRQVTVGGETHPIRRGDIAILMRTGNSSAPDVARQLERAGIRSWFDSDEQFFDAREVQTVLSLLRVVDNPARDLPMLGFLLSPLGGCTPDDVARLRAENPKTRLYTAMLRAASGGDAHFARLVETLRDFRSYAASLSAVKLLRYILDRTHYADIVRAGGQGERRAANLLLLSEYAARFCEFGGTSLTDFLRFIDRVQERSGDLKGAKGRNAPADAVRIMSIHRSKGLQFPVTIVAGTSKAFNKQDLRQRTCIHARLGLSGVRVGGSRDDRLSTLPHEALKIAGWKDAADEELRMLYVAATRAESLLIFTAAFADPDRELARAAVALPGDERVLPPYVLLSAGSSAQWLLSAFLRHPDASGLRAAAGTDVSVLPAEGHVRFSTVVLAEDSAASSRAEPSAEERAASAGETEDYRARLVFRYPFARAVTLPSKLTVTEIAKGGLAPSVSLREPLLARSHDFTPAERGTFLHRFLQFADYDAARSDPARERERLISMGYFTPQEAACVDLGKVQDFLNTPLVRAMQCAPVFRREFQFLRFERAADLTGDAGERCADEKIAVQGMVDCLYGDESHLVCVDYKTDHVASVEAFLDRYRPQLAMYEKAVGEAFGVPVTACLLYSFSLRRVFCVRGEMPPEAGENNA